MFQSVSGEPNASMTIPKHNSPMISITQRGGALLVEQEPRMKFGAIMRDRQSSCVRFNRNQCYSFIILLRGDCFHMITELLQDC